MKNIIKIFEDNFDNKSSINSKLLGTFIKQNGFTAVGNASKFVGELKPIQHYLGYDGNIYPKLRIEYIET